MTNIRILLIFVVTCPTCRQTSSAAASGTCPGCDGAIPRDTIAEAQAIVRRRRQTFKGRLSRLHEHMRAVTDKPLVFATRGIPRCKADHLTQVIRPAMASLRQRSGRVFQLLGTGTWDPAEAGCTEAFSELARTLDAGLDAVDELRLIMPPLEWRAVHRELARAMAQSVRGQVLWTLMISAPDVESALRLQTEGDAAMQASSRHVAQVTTLMQHIERYPNDGPFGTDGSVDIAALAWSAVSQSSISIKDASELVRAGFAELPDVSALSDEHAVLLLPLLTAGAGVVDPEMLRQCVVVLRAALDAGGPLGDWVKEPALLVERLNRGLDRAVSYIERFGRDWRYGLPRIHIMGTLTEVYRNLVEGPLRDLGSVVLIAARTGRGDDNGTYEAAVVDGVKAGEVVAELKRICFPHDDALYMIFRNASAHADIEVTDTGITAIERRIERGREVSRTQEHLNDDEFAEYIVALQEVILALQLTLLPWLWASEDQAVHDPLATMPVRQRQVNQTIALLGGMAGLGEVTVATSGDQVEISASSHDDDSDRREVKILSLVPEAFGAARDAATVTLSIAGLRPVTFCRDEFAESESDDAPHKLPLLGLTTARWLLESGSPWTERDEATYMAFPLTQLFFDCCQLVGEAPQRTDIMNQVVASMRAVLSRLDLVLSSDQRSALTRAVVEHLEVFVTALAKLAEVQPAQRSTAAARRLSQRAAATVEAVYELQQQALSIRDGRAAE